MRIQIHTHALVSANVHVQMLQQLSLGGRRHACVQCLRVHAYRHVHASVSPSRSLARSLSRSLALSRSVIVYTCMYAHTDTHACIHDTFTHGHKRARACSHPHMTV